MPPERENPLIMGIGIERKNTDRGNDSRVACFCFSDPLCPAKKEMRLFPGFRRVGPTGLPQLFSVLQSRCFAV